MPSSVWSHRIRYTLWFVTPLFTGAIIMAQELVAFRLYAPYFGYSIYVWGSLISVVMIALSVGYAAGGWIADKSSTDLPLYSMIFASSLYQLGILFIVYSLLLRFSKTGESAGSALASVIIFAPPMALMATTGPFLTRLMAKAGQVGSVAGKIYARSTLGGIAGILGTSFLLVPRFGTHKTLELICASSAVIGITGIMLRAPAMLLSFAVLIFSFRLVPGSPWGRGSIWTVESPYNLVRVERSGERIYLKLNDENDAHTIRDERGVWTGHYYDDFALGPLLVSAQRLLVLGLGGGASIAATRITAPQIVADAVEIDPQVVEAATYFFGVDAQDEKLHIHIADARPWMTRNAGRYDLVHVDLYQGGPYIPFYLVTQEFFQAVRDHMSAHGLMMMNLFDRSPKRELLYATVATVKCVFPSVMVLSVGSGNHMILAFNKSTSEELVTAKLEAAKANNNLKRLAMLAQMRISTLEVPPGITAFTDDFCPVEQMTRHMLHGN